MLIKRVFLRNINQLSHVIDFFLIIEYDIFGRCSYNSCSESDSVENNFHFYCWVSAQ